MIELFQKYIAWKILAHFLKYPTTKYYIKELARELKVSPGSVSTTVRMLETDKILERDEIGQTHLYKLNQEHPAATSLKKSYTLIRILEADFINRFLITDENIISLALYGSYAKGDYDEKSDLDVLIITSSKKDIFNVIGMELRDELEITLSMSIFRLSQWRQLSKKNDAFYRRIVENHVLLYGSGLE